MFDKIFGNFEAFLLNRRVNNRATVNVQSTLDLLLQITPII